MSVDRQSPAVKSNQKEQTDDKWTIRVPWRPGGLIDARFTPRGPDGEPISIRMRFMLVILEGCCRSMFFCWQGNKELAAAYGCSLSTMNALLKEMEDAGLLWRVLQNDGYATRQGIMLFRRLDTDQPVADPKAVPAAIVEMQREKAVRRELGYRKTGSRATRKLGAQATGKQGAEELPILKADPVEVHEGACRSVCFADNVVDDCGPGPAGEGDPDRGPDEPVAPEAGDDAPAVTPGDQLLDHDVAVRTELVRRLDDLTKPPRGSRGHAGTSNRYARLMLRALFDDESQRNCHRKTAWRIINGELDGALVLAAYDATMKGLGQRAYHLDRVNNVGAYFNRALQGLEGAQTFASIERGEPAGEWGEAVPACVMDDEEPFG